ncbi:D-alanyl-D-alanine carboxypeptidase/D-alanyl-D-alanine endopeptidase [Mesobacillus maritimus]|uniref:D-alanyl-D-alanine carboxypeptidase/D-alanyl-D-alanine-endopeptidase n=1 Tax=Mesobacillus maritimus TaxID=1643336 RepID=A0ABS7K169_9BACI|nr:D-alanyl-D-alanine carboxypeptidase/D-alanyl-D-alanine-endopeptidase [Mesobacillus maritimus]MBY0095910.1 D-alanyl-D-alanine carboxypeptidase/D-alanyl-D-alanine-endopeptidase [Mesobacillus maritimus]
MLSFVTFFLVPSSHSSGAEPNNRLQTEINQLLQEEPMLKGGIAGISIRSGSTGEILYDHNGDTRMRPASNMKLLTSAAALSVLGGNYRFKTEVKINGNVIGNTLKGNLYLKGYGDPTLLRKDLTKMAKDIARTGISIIQGDLIADDSWFDDVRLSKDLVWSDEYAYYGSQISALTVSPNKDYDTGTVIVEVSPGRKVGDAGHIKLSHRTEYINVINQSVTISPEGKTDLSIEREHGKNTIYVKGFLPLGAKSKKEWISVWEPTEFVLDLFKQELAKQGISVKGRYKVGETSKDARILTSHLSMPLSKILIPFMKLSNNGHAEILVKAMGKLKKGEGSWEKGLDVLIEQLPRLGVDPNTVVIRDGSGISHVNLIPANEISGLLYTVQKEEWFPSFITALPCAGKKDKMIGGTLIRRMESLNVKAKTGTISTVTSLSGYVTTKKGETFIFSILLNNLLDEENGKDIEDKIVGIIANHNK